MAVLFWVKLTFNLIFLILKKNIITSSFWYAVTAINCVSGKEWLVIILLGPPTRTMWMRGSYLWREFNMILKWKRTEQPLVSRVYISTSREMAEKSPPPVLLRSVCWWVWLCWMRRRFSSSARRSLESPGECTRSWASEVRVCHPAPTPRSHTSTCGCPRIRSPAGWNTWRSGPIRIRSLSAPETCAWVKNRNN